MAEIPGNGSLFMQNLIKRLLQLLERDDRTIIKKAVDQLNDKNIQICSVKDCVQICKISCPVWTGRGCGNCGKFFCKKKHKNMYNHYACMKCWVQYCRKCRIVSECNLCEVEASEEDSEFTFYYCHLCLPDHKKQMHRNVQKHTKHA